MPVNDLHRRVAAIALAAAAGHGFALGGGNALLAHGVISRPTQDVDLFTDQEHGVQAAADAVQAALRRAGFQAERQDQTGGLSYMFLDIGEGLAEWIVTAAAGEQMLLQLAYFDRGRQPVVMDIGPVLDLEVRRGPEGMRAGPAASSRGTTPTWPPRWAAALWASSMAPQRACRRAIADSRATSSRSASGPGRFLNAAVMIRT
jgi:Nucleotidyl transferase AbiEii toxin, Type IV TA system